MKKILKYFLLIFSILLLTLIIFLYTLPYKKLLINYASTYNYHLVAENVSFKAPKGLLIKKIVIYDKDKTRAFFQSEEVLLKLNILKLFSGNISMDISSKSYSGNFIGNLEFNLFEELFNNISLEFKDIDLYKLPYCSQFNNFKVVGALSGEIKLNFKNYNEFNGNIAINKPIVISDVFFNNTELPTFEFKNIFLEFNFKDNAILVKQLELKGEIILIKINGSVEFENYNSNLLVWVGTQSNTPPYIKQFISLVSNGNENGLKLKIQGQLNNPEIIPVLQ